MSMQVPFNVRSLFTWKSDRLYRVYHSSGNLYFIRIGGQGGWEHGFHAHPIATVIGGLVLGLLKRRTEAKLDQLDHTDPMELVRNHKDSFSLSPSEASETSIEPRAGLGSHGMQFGRWLLSDYRGAKWCFQFETLEDMQWALHILPGFFGEKLVVNVQWDPKRTQFVRRGQ